MDDYYADYDEDSYGEDNCNDNVRSETEKQIGTTRMYGDFLFAIEDNDLARLKILLETQGLPEVPDNGYLLLSMACAYDCTEIVEYLLSKNCDVNLSAERIYYSSPLDFAIDFGNLKVIKMLLKRGVCDVGKRHKDIVENTVLVNLLHAIENAEDGILETLISLGFREDNCKGCSPLHLAAFHGDMEILEKFLAKEAVVDAKTLSGMTPIHFGCYRGHLDIVTRLINQGASVNELANCALKRNSILNLGELYHSCSPLHIAVANEHLSLVKLLLDHGANVNAQCAENQTALYLASETSYEITKLVLSYCPDVNDIGNKRVLANAILKRVNLNTVQCLFEYGFSLDPEYVKDKDFVIEVCVQGYVKAMENLIRHGLDVNNTELDFSLLHFSVMSKQRGLCALLLNAGANVNKKDCQNKSPFFYAVENCDVEIAKLLLANGADRTENIIDAFNIAIQNQGLEMVEFILHNYGNLSVNSDDNGSSTSLHHTVFKTKFGVLTPNGETKFGVLTPNGESNNDSGDIIQAKTAKLLLTNGFNVDSLTDCHTFGSVTTLVGAAFGGYKNVVEVLLKHGAEVNFQDSNGMTALHNAVTCGGKEIIDFNGKGRYVALKRFVWRTEANKKSYADIVELLLKYGIDCNLQDKRGLTALHLSVMDGNQEIIQILLKSVCNINLKDQFGHTAVHKACINDFDENLNILLKYISSVMNPVTKTCVDSLNLKDLKGLTPLMIASINGCQKIVKILLNTGVNVNSQDNDGKTALHHAVLHGHSAVASSLLKFGSDINKIATDGRTPLSYCCRATCCKSVGLPVNYYIRDVDCAEIIKMLESHVNALMAVGYYICEINVTHMEWSIKESNNVLRSRIPDIVSLEDCLAELNILKKYFVYGTVSFYDIVTASVDKFAKYLRNDDIMKSLNSHEYANRFPIYADLIFGRFKMAERRKLLIERCIMQLKCGESKFCRLPYVCIEEFLSYLSDDDLRVFIAVNEHFC